MSLNKQNWSDIAAGPISEDAIRARNVPPENFKVYVNHYQAGESFSVNAGHAFDLYVLTGSCSTTVDDQELSLAAAEYITLDSGTHKFAVTSAEPLTLVKVFGRV